MEADVSFRLICFLLLFFAIPVRIPIREDPTDKIFRRFIITYNRTYHGNETEYVRRLQIFKKTIENINYLNENQRKNTAKFGITKYSDLDDYEFSKNYLRAKKKNSKNPQPVLSSKVEEYSKKLGFNLTGLPLKVDWRQNGYVTDIRNQGGCGSCYAQSVIGTIETLLAYKMNLTSPIKLSIQQMIDCAENFNYGCLGGNTCTLLQWIQNKNISILPEEHYPSTKNSLRSCKYPSSLKLLPKDARTVRVKDYSCVNFTGNELYMVAVLARDGPIVASVNAALWKNYIGGVIKYHCDGPSNHAVQIVGYDLTAEDPFYIVRNSWGTDFGNDGFAKIAIGNNVCNIASQVAVINIDV